jgi:hypothetical protein
MSNNTVRELSLEEKESTFSTPATSMFEPNPTSRKAQEPIADDGTEEEREFTVENATEYASGFKLVAVVLALALSVFLVSLDMTIVATAIPKITDVSLYA